MMSSKYLVGAVGRMRDTATESHMGQQYGDKPYMFHVDQVVTKCEEMFDSREGEILWDKALRGEIDKCMGIHLDDFKNIIRCVALGHDLIEDTVICEADLLYMKGFPPVVIDAIVALTKVEGESLHSYLGRCMDNPIAKFVKKADTLCNMSNSVLDGATGRISKYTRQLDMLYDGFPAKAVNKSQSKPPEDTVVLHHDVVLDGAMLELSVLGRIDIKVQQKLNLKLNLMQVSDDVTIFSSSGLKEHNKSIIKCAQKQFIDHNM